MKGRELFLLIWTAKRALRNKSKQSAGFDDFRKYDLGNTKVQHRIRRWPDGRRIIKTF